MLKNSFYSIWRLNTLKNDNNDPYIKVEIIRNIFTRRKCPSQIKHKQKEPPIQIMRTKSMIKKNIWNEKETMNIPVGFLSAGYAKIGLDNINLHVDDRYIMCSMRGKDKDVRI